VLLAEAGFHAVRVNSDLPSLNAAEYLGEADRIGSIREGKAADLV